MVSFTVFSSGFFQDVIVNLKQEILFFFKLGWKYENTMENSAFNCVFLWQYVRIF